MKKPAKNKLPPGWDEERIRRLIDYYDNQSDEEAIAEMEAALEDEEADEESRGDAC
jgi:hypothetical protein